MVRSEVINTFYFPYCSSAVPIPVVLQKLGFQGLMVCEMFYSEFCFWVVSSVLLIFLFWIPNRLQSRETLIYILDLTYLSYGILYLLILQILPEANSVPGLTLEGITRDPEIQTMRSLSSSHHNLVKTVHRDRKANTDTNGHSEALMYLISLDPHHCP